MTEPTPGSDDTLLLAFDEPYGDRSVVLEDDGADGGVPRLRAESDVALDWSPSEVAIEIDGILVARMRADIKPGWSLGATSPSALALPLPMYPATRAS